MEDGSYHLANAKYGDNWTKAVQEEDWVRHLRNEDDLPKLKNSERGEERRGQVFLRQR